MPKNGHLSIILVFSIFLAIEASFVLAQERPNFDIALVLDHSYSMFQYKDGRMHEAKIAAINFIDRLDPAYSRAALIRFSDNSETNKQLGTPFVEVKKKIESYHLDNFSQFTDLQKAIQKAREELTSIRARPNAKKLAILLSDGSINRPKLNGRENISYAHSQTLQEADIAKEKGIVIHTIAVGGDKADKELLAAIASRTGGNYYIATSPIDLIPIYEHIATNITNSSGGGGGSVYIVNNSSSPTPIQVPVSIDKSGANDINRKNNYYEMNNPNIGALHQINQKIDTDNEAGKEENKNALQKALLLGTYFSDYLGNLNLLIITALIGAYLTWLFGIHRKKSLLK